jgi:uncharacterized Zn finger protein
MFTCEKCGNEMKLIIEEIQDTGCAYYCYKCGSVLVTKMRDRWFDNAIVGEYEEESEWFMIGEEK